MAGVIVSSASGSGQTIRTPDGATELTSLAAALAHQADDAATQLATARDRHTQAASALTAAGDGRQLKEARETLDQLVHVTTLPPPLSDPALAAAEATRARAAHEHRNLLAQHRDATVTVAARQRTVDTLTAQRTLLDERLDTLLPDRPAGAERDCDADRAHLDELTAAREQLARTEQQARAAVQQAETAYTSAAAARHHAAAGARPGPQPPPHAAGHVGRPRPTCRRHR